MNARLAVAFLMLLGSTGCLVVNTGNDCLTNNGGCSANATCTSTSGIRTCACKSGYTGNGFTCTQPKSPGNVTVHWTFSGQRCSDVPQVKSVKVTIPGETLMNGGVFPCNVSGFDGVTLNDFAGGFYDYTVLALGFSDEQLFTSSGSFTVDGSITVNPDLTPVGGANTYAYLTWTFPALSGAPNPTCAQAGITSVLSSIDGVAATSLACVDGRGTSPGVQTPFLTAGVHDIQLTAVDSAGYAYFRYTGTLTTKANNPVAVEYALQWVVGGVAVKWDIRDSLGPISCGGAMALNDVYINFEDSTGALVYPYTASVPGDKKACTSLGVEYPYLKPGTYTVRLWAFGAGNPTPVYQEDVGAPGAVKVTAVAGQFVSVGNATLVHMVRTN